MTTDFAQQFEEAFRQLGIRLGRQLAAQILAEQQAGEGGLGEDELAEEDALMQAQAKILPGLTGRRRKPGEMAPRCGRAGCNKASRTRGYCQTHYVQWLKAGEGRRHAG